MKIAIDLNDVYRAFTRQVGGYYKKEVDRSFDVENTDVWTNDLSQVFPFETRKKYLTFLYDEFPFEIFGSAQQCEKNLTIRLNEWLTEIEDLDEEPTVCIVSTKEYEKSIGASYYFLGKYAPKIREAYMLLEEESVWDKCDVLITANPNILSNIPEDKLCVKINTSYNKEIENEFNYDGLMSFLNDTEIIKNLNNKLIENKND